MKRIIPVFAVLLLGGCTATSPQYIAQKQDEVLAKAEATCSMPVNAHRKYLNCLNGVVHNSGYWGQGVRVVASNDGTPRIVAYQPSHDYLDNPGGDRAYCSPN